MGIAAIRRRFLGAAYPLVTRQWRDAAEQVEWLDEGSDQRKALHRKVSSHSRYVCSMHIKGFHVKTRPATPTDESASDHAFAVISS